MNSGRLITTLVVSLSAFIAGCASSGGAITKATVEPYGPLTFNRPGADFYFAQSGQFTRAELKDGVWVANGNLAIRHLGIPTVTVPMGTMSDIGMPVGLTIAGRAYADADLLRWAAAFEALHPRRTSPPRTPELF